MRAKWVVVLLALVSGTAVAGGPRFLSSSSNGGVPMAWANTPLQYYTDPGDLSATVSHAQADAVVAAAAAVWNVATSSMVLSQGGVLSEHVSSSNTYFDGNEVVFPADVQASNYAAKPIAVIYDMDGSVTDLLLGAGASDPTGCRQTEVTESVDGFGATTIQHALLVINGRCVGSSTDQLNQLKYLLMRKFGRVLGLGWSQANDAVFTQAVTPTATMMAYWPVMHPIDVVCGPYTYLCMQNPFSLRVDDLSALAMLYPVTSANLTAGKVLSQANSIEVDGGMSFPIAGLGMEQINLVIRTQASAGEIEQPWQLMSAMTGYQRAADFGNPVSGLYSADQVHGWSYSGYQGGTFDFRRVPNPPQIVHIDAESVNPLYTGDYALGTTTGTPMEKSGTPLFGSMWTTSGMSEYSFSTTMTGAASTCWWSTSGQESQPVAVDASGWWSGLLCSGQTPNWGVVSIRAGRTWTLETIATDESGASSTVKAQPVLGVWNATDAVGTLPTVAAMSVPMNGRVTGLTQLAVPAAAADASYRLVVADVRGHGRPDLTFSGRVLYADAVTPQVTTVSGGQITITGMGFANGNRVTVNGVVAQVVSWSSNTIVATVPSMAVAKASAGVPVDVAVVDLTTGGTTVMTGALSYPGGGAYGVVKVSAPTSLETGKTAATAFAVKVVAADGVTVVPGASVRFAVASGSASLLGCGVAASCTLVTNTVGVVQTSVAGVSAGSVVLTATEVTGGASVQVALTDADPVRSAVIATATAYVAAGASVSLPVVMNAVEDGMAASGVVVSWSVSAGMVLSSVTGVTASDGSASVLVGTNGMAAGTGSLRACVWTNVCANWSVVAVDPSQWVPGVVSGAGQSVSYTAALAPVVLRVTDMAGHALAGATVTVAQTVDAWEGVCTTGRCAAAPVLASSSASTVTDANGLVTVVPLQVNGVPQVVNVAVSAGASGFLTMALVKTP